MNIKLALMALFCGVAMSCGVSEGQLLDRMLSKAGSHAGGCSSCEAAAAAGDFAPAPVTVSEPCGCEAAPAPFTVEPVAISEPCGCGAAPAVASAPITESCGCAAAPAAGGCLLDRLKRNMDSTHTGGGCGCSATPVTEAFDATAVPSVTPIIDSAPVVLASGSGCGCGEAAPVAHVASSCGCNAGGSSCGCGSAHGGAVQRPPLTLRDRLRGNRVARDREGRVIGASSNGCNPPCPQRQEPSCGCGCEAPPVPVPFDTGCSTCAQPVPCQSCQGEVIQGQVIGAEGEVIGAPILASPAVIDGDSSTVEESIITEEDPVEDAIDSVDPVSPIDADDVKDAIEKVVPGLKDTPSVDPKAFIFRNGNSKS